MRSNCAMVLLLSACAGGTPEQTEDDRTELTCDVIADDAFCWNVGVEEAYACIGDTVSDGSFDASRTTCTLGDGSTVVFDAPVPVDPFADSADNYLWTFSVNDPSGSQCMRFVDGDQGLELSTASGNTIERVAGFGMEIECPDGEVFYASNAFDLFECDLGTLPGYGYSGNVSWQLLGGPDGRFNLFDCQ